MNILPTDAKRYWIIYNPKSKKYKKTILCKQKYIPLSNSLKGA